MPFAFDNLDRRGVEILLGGLDESSHRLAGRTAEAWVTAARTGSPAHDDLPWPAYDPAGERLPSRSTGRWASSPTPGRLGRCGTSWPRSRPGVVVD